MNYRLIIDGNSVYEIEEMDPEQDNETDKEYKKEDEEGGWFPALNQWSAEAAAVSAPSATAEEQKNDPDTAVVIAKTTAVMSPTSTTG